MEPDFKGWVTKFGVKCSDGRTIKQGSFSAQNGAKVPLVWQHGHDNPTNVLGHVLLEDRPEGVYGQGFFNDTDHGKHQKTAVEHRDVDSMSIYANRLVEQNKVVSHGVIREVSLVLAGANPEAKIDHITIRHSDGEVEDLDDEAIIKVGSELEHEDSDGRTIADIIETMNEEQKGALFIMLEEAVKHADGSDVEHADGDRTVKQVLETLNDEQAAAFNYVIQQLVGGSAEHTDKGDSMTNVFEQQARQKLGDGSGPALSHSDLAEFTGDAVKKFGSYKELQEAFVLKHGIENLPSLFPDPKDLNTPPMWLTRRVDWVGKVWGGITKTPFSRVRVQFADLTYEAARAKGYVKGNQKKEEFFGMFRRSVTPTTIVKLQKMDRDDILDITDFDVINWLKGEMRFMITEEMARAVLVGDGRDIDDPDKIRPENIRPIAYENELYAPSVELSLGTTDSSLNAFIDQIIKTRVLYKGSGSPSLYTTEALITRMLLLRDADGKRLYRSVADLASELRVSEIVEVEIMNEYPDIHAILVNLSDYRTGTDRGGELTMFDDFDIDFNKYTYLIETRFSGMLTHPASAIVYRNAGADTLATPVVPAYNKTTKIVTIPTTTGVDYLIDGVVKAPGTYTLAVDTRVYAQAKTGYYLAVPFEAKYSPLET